MSDVEHVIIAVQKSKNPNSNSEGLARHVQALIDMSVLLRERVLSVDVVEVP